MRRWMALLALPAALACGGESSQGGPARSPSLDYPPPPARDAQGQVIGVDGVPPEDRMRETPRVGIDGPHEAEGPRSHEKHQSKKPPDPCKQIGLRNEDGSPHCPKSEE